MNVDGETRACVIVADPRGFVRATMRNGIEMTLEDAREAIATTGKIARDIPVPVLVDSRLIKSQTREARDYLGSDDAARICIRVALLIGSPVSRVINNFFLSQSNKTKVPHRLFTDEAAAIAWLLEAHK